MASDENGQSSQPERKHPLAPEMKEQFLANWLEHMPEVATWSDDEILSGILTGM